MFRALNKNDSISYIVIDYMENNQIIENMATQIIFLYV